MSLHETFLSFPFLLQDQVILIVGAAAGLGWLLAQAFLASQAKLILADTRPFPAEAKEESSWTIYESSGDPAFLEDLPTRIEESFGRLDLVIHTTEEDQPADLCHLPVEEIERYVSLNLTGAMKLARAVLPSFLCREHGTLVFVGSYVDGQMALPYHAISAATRAGLTAFAESLHREIQGTPIQIRYLSTLPVESQTSAISQRLWKAIGLPQITVEDLLRSLAEALRESKPIYRMFPHHTHSFPLLSAPSTKASHDLLLGRHDQAIKALLQDAHAQENSALAASSGSLAAPKTPPPLSAASATEEDGDTAALSPQRKWTAIGLVAASFVLYGLLFAIPFVPLATQAKVVLFAVLFLASEIAFWIGGFLLGKPLLRRMRRYINPLNWFPKNNPKSPPH